MKLVCLGWNVSIGRKKILYEDTQSSPECAVRLNYM